jgi:hypothetical protein
MFAVKQSIRRSTGIAMGPRNEGRRPSDHSSAKNKDRLRAPQMRNRTRHPP